ncbi:MULTISPECIES: 50S ribosomal protein L23 [Runella]|uniref:Large ribosomal subunit protein uL23 n=1 Tax=Runella defluvii TaxID=370973 RepID=A0A7W6ESD1_9BACT|nr:MULTISPECIES: 50S ribosomal protein L23 [Runella]MCA0229625.1 50S ribosomal protein L23 [Bacteroidota bacterium]HAK77296.1 50S ribosomal protein L23 [Runella sp.]AYQ34728.1 50S ribosomal protein L23 [Runella sp. SP2]MBB3840376.1 large subunit ribosomal protein L23 [Runella defluvii]HAO50491.1 50S ribosomal protein L23 [Runella sp.]
MSVLKRPILTEKATALSNLGKYVFEVTKTANKIEIANAIEKMYGVKVASVDTMRSIGRKKTRMSRGKAISGITSTYKKAIVTLKAGEIIDIYADIV